MFESLSPQSRAVSVSVESWGWTQTGHVCEDNQDSFLNWPERLLWAVADGVGGSERGKEASALIAGMLTLIPPPKDLDEHVANVVHELEKVHLLTRQRSERIGGTAACTVVTLLVAGSEAACLWAGDSRCYLLRDGVLYQCTKDHTLRRQKVEAGELTKAEAERMIRGNIITKAVGGNEKLALEKTRFRVKVGDRFLLCTDGLSNILNADALAHYLTRPSAKSAVDGIIKAIDDIRQPDNITFIAVYISHAG